MRLHNTYVTLPSKPLSLPIPFFPTPPGTHPSVHRARQEGQARPGLLGARAQRRLGPSCLALRVRTQPPPARLLSPQGAETAPVPPLTVRAHRAYSRAGPDRGHPTPAEDVPRIPGTRRSATPQAAAKR